MQAGTFVQTFPHVQLMSNDPFPYLNKQFNLWLSNTTRWSKIIPLELRLLVQSKDRNKFSLQFKWSVLSVPLSSSHISLNFRNPQLVQSCSASCPVSAPTHQQKLKPNSSAFFSINFVNFLASDPDADKSSPARPLNPLPYGRSHADSFANQI